MKDQFCNLKNKIMKKLIILLGLLTFQVYAQQNKEPKLVVGIVVDQMRYDYIQRFWNDFESNGFKRLIKDGYFNRNTHFNYVPTYTGPGHASIYTGTSPRYHGIIANNWFDKSINKEVYCASDPSANSVGVKNSEAGKMSPRRMLANTFGDELKIYTQQKSKNFGISLKDRGAILSIGHMADGAFWMDSKTGKMISSDFYWEELPKWADKFNNKNLPKKYLQKRWTPLKDYDELSTGDNNIYEGTFPTEKQPTFPHDLAKISKENGYGTLKATPFGNTYLVDFAVDLIKNEELGRDNIPDMLTVSFSSTDYVGHQYGTQAWETKDTYLRLDYEISRLLNYIDKHVGLSNAVIFLTADHGGAHNAQYLIDHNAPGGYFDYKKMQSALEIYLQEKYKVHGLIKNVSNQQIFFNHQLLESNALKYSEVEFAAKSFLLKYTGISQAFGRSVLSESISSEYTAKLLSNGFHPARSADLAYVLNPAWMEYHHYGTTHGSSYSYDTHVPLIWYGWNIKAGESYDRVDITDIASTLCRFFNISPPNGSDGTGINLPYSHKRR